MKKRRDIFSLLRVGENTNTGELIHPQRFMKRGLMSLGFFFGMIDRKYAMEKRKEIF